LDLFLYINGRKNDYNCYVIKNCYYSMQLESNIRGVAFSASWLKPVDDWPVESPGLSAGASRPAQYQKRGAGGRRGRRRSLASESGTATAIATDDDNSWTWWTGGNISKRTLQRGAILRSTIRKAARQGTVNFNCY
jgi:hypothetical protein